MKKIIMILILISNLIFSCISNKDIINKRNLNQNISIKVDAILIDAISIRAILIDKNIIWYSADKGRFGFVNHNNKQKFESIIDSDSLIPEFRSIGKTKKNIFILNVGNPARMYQIPKNTRIPKIVYYEKNKKVFYDSMQFWNDKEGIAIGDLIDNCLSVITSRDGGNSWKKLSCFNLPKVEEGEAAFAASNTNIIVKANKTWIVSGGKKSRVFYSGDKGKSWEVFNTPIIQGSPMSGIFSADFYNEKIGFAVGGDYDNQKDNSSNKIRTLDGGKTWELAGINKAFGYASCVQFVPNKKGRELVSVGTSGVYYSFDFGQTWKKTLEDKDLYTIRFENQHTAFAAGKNKIIRINFNKK